MRDSRRRLSAVLHSCALGALLLAERPRSQGPSGDPSAPPEGLTAVFVDVGQGDATILLGPTGTALLYDAGPTGAGKGAVLTALRRLDVKRLQYVIPSHYDADHVGGLDEVMERMPFASVWDRGTRDQPTTAAYRDYVRAAGSKRRTVAKGQVFDLGGGARARVLAYDGEVLGRSTRLPIRGSSQQENAASLVLRVDYGDFSMWLGGDLTGGGNGTYDVETPVAGVCGDVDVYRVNHHGSATSTNDNLVSSLRPEVCILSNGARNPFGHPHNEVVNRLNPRSWSRCLLDTTAGAGNTGFTVGGTMTLVTDGWRLRIDSAGGGSLELYTDEFAGRLPAPGELVFTEIHRQPTVALGEYLEVQNRGGAPLSLAGVTVSGNLGRFTIGAPYRLLPGGRLLLYAHGDPATNGRLPFGHCWPFRAITIGNVFDTLKLQTSGGTTDTLSFSSGFAGGSGRAAERVDVLAGASAGNFEAATTRYATDYGTPGWQNSVDRTRYRLTAGAEFLPARAPGGRAIHFFDAALAERGKLDLGALSTGTSPGIIVGGTRIPLNLDGLFALSLQLPGFFGVVPSNGLRAWRLQLPADVPSLRLYHAHFLLDPLGQHPVPSSSGPFRIDIR